MKNFLFIFLALSFTSCADWGRCEQFNIDSYELIMGLDIPKVKDSHCFSDETTRITVFEFDPAEPGFLSSYATWSQYANRYGLVEVSFREVAPFSGHALAAADFPELDPKTLVYEKAGETKGRKWKVVVAPQANTLIAEVLEKNEGI